MTIKKMISAFCLAAGLVIAAPAAASVTGLPQGTAATVQAAVKNGWQKDATGMYYLKNGRRVTGKQQISGYTYYFNTQGYRQTGVVQIGKNAYYFHPANGRLLTGKAGIIRLGGTERDLLLFQRCGRRTRCPQTVDKSWRQMVLRRRNRSDQFRYDPRTRQALPRNAHTGTYYRLREIHL